MHLHFVKKSSQLSIFAVLFVGLIYLLFPSSTLTADAYAFAADIKHHLAIFRPHHLLYNPLMSYLTFPLTHWLGFETINALQFVNSLLMISSLLLLRKILGKLDYNDDIIVWIIFFVGFSNGFWRFAVGNEPYILAILISLLGSYFFLIKKKTFIVSVIMSSACLVHPVQFWWWLGFFLIHIFDKKNPLKAVYFLIGSMVVPIVYAIVYYIIGDPYYQASSLVSYMLYDYFYGNAMTDFGSSHFLFFIIGIVRTFFQVHSYLPGLFKRSSIFYLPLILSSISLMIGVFYFFRKNKIKASKYLGYSKFQLAHVFAIICTILFSLFSVGNSEFMIGIPILLLLVVTKQFVAHNIFLIRLKAVNLFIWNFLLFAFPYFYFPINNNESSLKIILNAKRYEYFISKDNILAEQYSYKSGNFINPNIIEKERISDSLFIILEENEAIIYTNFLIGDEKRSRGDFYNNNKISSIYSFNFVPIDSQNTVYGIEYIYQLKKKN